MYVDPNIIKRCKKLDRNAFFELFKMYERYLYKICYSYMQNEQDALDVTQEIYIKVFSNISRFDEKMPFHPWIRTIAVNTCINFKRKVKPNVVSLHSGGEDDVALEDIIPACDDVESEIESKDLGRIIKENLKDLNPKHRMVLILRYYEGLSYEEISSVLKEPLGTIKTDIHRARNILKEKLKGALSL
ncbi:MAG: RNA polymerase sigma factor [Caulobacteraceae bacterium]